MMTPQGCVALRKAAELLQSSDKMILATATEMGISLVSRGCFRYLRLTDMDRIGERIATKPKRLARLDSLARKEEHEEIDDDPLSQAELTARIEAARRFGRKCFGRLELTDERLEAELRAMRRGVAS